MKHIVKAILLIAVVTLFTAPKIHAQVSIDVSIQANVPPPEIPVYEQPPCPVDGYLWQPGYWAWDPDEEDYYWVPGVWVEVPEAGLLWTPSYWSYEGNVYVYHPGYWGRHVGFYGGINYGGGYFGIGFAGGSWEGSRFRYNTAAVRVNTTVVHNVYVDQTVINKTTIVNNRVSYNGGNGVPARPRPEEEQAMREQHVKPTGQQVVYAQAAAKDRSQFAKANRGNPSKVSMERVNTQKFTPNVQPKNNRPATPANDNKPANQPPANDQQKTNPPAVNDRSPRTNTGQPPVNPANKNDHPPVNDQQKSNPPAVNDRTPRTNTDQPPVNKTPPTNPAPPTEVPHNDQPVTNDNKKNDQPPANIPKNTPPANVQKNNPPQRQTRQQQHRQQPNKNRPPQQNPNKKDQ